MAAPPKEENTHTDCSCAQGRCYTCEKKKKENKTLPFTRALDTTGTSTFFISVLNRCDKLVKARENPQIRVQQWTFGGTLSCLEVQECVKDLSVEELVCTGVLQRPVFGALITAVIACWEPKQMTH